MATAAVTALEFRVEDVTGQKVTTFKSVPVDGTIRELIDDTLARMKLPATGPGGRPVAYQARLARGGRHLHDSERVSDALQNDDRVVLLPSVEAGGARPA